VRELEGHYVEQFQLIRKWVHAFSAQHKNTEYTNYVNEAATLLLLNNFDKKCVIKTDTTITISDLHGSHLLVQEGAYRLDYNDFTDKLSHYEREIAPRFSRYVKMKKDLADTYKKQLRLHEFEPRVLSSFVRNKLIDKVYLPIFGDNLAKQIGTADENTRTDRMGLLLLISPPGYGKTTLMEYIANRLGLIFMKINGPALGHHVTSLDPADAGNMAAKQELEKLNLALEMGDNVMLYLDDIQHCNPDAMLNARLKAYLEAKVRPTTYAANVPVWSWRATLIRRVATSFRYRICWRIGRIFTTSATFSATRKRSLK